MLAVTESGELRLEIEKAKGKVKTYVQSKIPLQKAIEYSEGEINLFEKALKANLNGPSENELRKYRIEFVAKLFDDEEVTYDLLLTTLDTLEIETVYDIINYRVMGNKKEDSNEDNDSKK